MLTLSLLGIGAIAVASVVTVGLMAYTINGALTWFSENASLQTPIDNAMQTAEIINDVSTNLAESVVEAVETVANIAIEKAEDTVNLAETAIGAIENTRTGIAVLSDISYDLRRRGGLTDEEIGAIGGALIGVPWIYTIFNNVQNLSMSESHSRTQELETDPTHHVYKIYINNNLRIARIRPLNLKLFIIASPFELQYISSSGTVLIPPDIAKIGISHNGNLRGLHSQRAQNQIARYHRSKRFLNPISPKVYTNLVLEQNLMSEPKARSREKVLSALMIIEGHSMHRHKVPRFPEHRVPGTWGD